MTNTELKKKIAGFEEQDWLKSVTVTFNFALNKQQSVTGVTAIYEFVNQQIKGWDKFDDLPEQFESCKDKFINIKVAIDSFVDRHYAQSRGSLGQDWRHSVNNLIDNTSISNCLPYNSAEVIFLVDIHQNTPEYFDGAYQSLTKTNRYNINSPDLLYGAILAYEFELQDKTELTSRKNKEQRSISRLKTDFQKYLTESEQQLSTYLNEKKTNFDKHVVQTDELISEKEALFTDWFEKTKKEQWQNWFDPTTQKISDLETTYKEKLKLEEPAKYWSSRAEDLRKQGWRVLIILVSIVIFTCIFLGYILLNPPDIFKESILSDDISIAIKWILIYATILSFLAYCIRALAKTMFSAFHLARDCEERHTLTYFYLSLTKDSLATESERNLIMQSLFSRADTGLLKEDSSPTMPSDIANNILNR